MRQTSTRIRDFPSSIAYRGGNPQPKPKIGVKAGLKAKKLPKPPKPTKKYGKR